MTSAAQALERALAPAPNQRRPLKSAIQELGPCETASPASARVAVPHGPRVLQAELFLRQLQGQSKALTISARNDEGDPVECIVKLNSRLKFPPTEHLREWLACALGAALGIRVPIPYQVEIGADFARAIKDDPIRRDAPEFVNARETAIFRIL